ncbi:unnamed protein product [Linum trigynum]|uniref:Uncharacterized protein n=1 Tax=Linum trigynum TaxID=586398 RepID=A0AAV2GT33_9ROSI
MDQRNLGDVLEKAVSEESWGRELFGDIHRYRKDDGDVACGEEIHRSKNFNSDLLGGRSTTCEALGGGDEVPHADRVFWDVPNGEKGVHLTEWAEREVEAQEMNQKEGLKGVLESWAWEPTNLGVDIGLQALFNFLSIQVSQPNMLMLLHLWKAFMVWPIFHLFNPQVNLDDFVSTSLLPCYLKPQYQSVMLRETDETDEASPMAILQATSSEEENMFQYSELLANIVKLGMENSLESPDLPRENTMKEVLSRRKKAPPLSPRERALRLLGIEEGDATSIITAGRPRRNGYAPLRITHDF